MSSARDNAEEYLRAKSAAQSDVAPISGPDEFDPIEQEKRAWLASLAVDDADEVVFQFETLVKALDRFFNVANHPARRGGPLSIEHDLRIEILVADRRMRSLLQLCHSVLNEADTSAFTFRSYVETYLLSDLDRDALLSRHQVQNTPLESLYLLQIGLRALVQISSALLAADHVSLNGFRALGHQYTSLIIQNRYFNPLRSRGFSPIYDRVGHPILQHAVREASSERLRRGLSLLILMLNRYLRIVSWIRPNAATKEELYDALPLLALLRSDFRTLAPYLEDGFPKRLFPQGPSNDIEAAFLARVDGFAFQLGMENRKVFEQLLLDFSQTSSIAALRSGLEAAHGLLNAFFQQTIVGIVQSVLPDVQGKDIFEDFISRFEQSKRLREDLWVFHEILRDLVARFQDDKASPAERRQGYDGLLEFMTYFFDLSLKLVRAADHETFANFFASVHALERETFDTPNRNREIARNFEHFRIFLETTIGHINQRVDLQGMALDEPRTKAMLQKFLPGLDPT